MKNIFHIRRSVDALKLSLRCFEVIATRLVFYEMFFKACYTGVKEQKENCGMKICRTAKRKVILTRSLKKNGKLFFIAFHRRRLVGARRRRFFSISHNTRRGTRSVRGGNSFPFLYTNVLLLFHIRKYYYFYFA